MVRYLFDGGEAVIDTAGNTQANYGFTVWTERTGGTDVTADMMAPDGVTPAAVQTDSDGEVPYLRGPDGVRLPYRDMGTDTRTPWYSAEAVAEVLAGGAGGVGVSSHGALTGLANDDHLQYHNNTRGDVRYYTKGQVDTAVGNAATAQSAADRNRANHTGAQGQSTVTGLVADLAARIQVQSVTTGSETRPAGSNLVWWIGGTTQPTNMAVGDVWLAAGTVAPGTDTTPPSVPTGVGISGITSTGAVVTWSPSSDNVAVTGYDVQVGGSSVATPTAATYTLSGLTASTSYSVRVRARDAAGNWSALSTAVVFNTPATGASPEHSVWAATAHPGTITKTVDAPLTLATAFYTAGAGANGWRCVGARLYVPTGITVPATCSVAMWIGTNPDLSTTATRTGTMTGITAGGWNEARWATSYVMTPGAPVWIAYRFADGTYLSTASVTSSAIQSNNTTLLYAADATEFPGGRSKFRYDDGSIGASTGHYSIDIIVDEG